MTIPIKTHFEISELCLYKNGAIENVKKLVSFAKEKGQEPITRTASTNENLILLFTEMLKCLHLNTQGDVKDVMHNLMANGGDNLRSATSKSSNKSTEIKIASKRIKDSHYQVDVSKDIVDHEGTKLHMISCYMRDAYLGRYVIKRNYFFTVAREEAADNAYNEIILKMNSLKDRYYNGVIKVSSITTQAKTILDGVISELEMSDDSLGTTVNRLSPQ